MSHTGFVIAMAANIGFAACFLPRRILRRKREYLIVNRWGGNGELLSVARTEVKVSHGPGAPIELTPRWTWLALLTLDADVGSGTRFRLLSELPAATTIAGHFIPARGQVRLTGPMERLHLALEGLDAHCLRRSARPVACRDEAGRRRAEDAWQIEADRVPWSGEFVAPLPG